MSLVSGPGRGGVATDTTNQLFTQKHVDYIKKLDTVRFPFLLLLLISPSAMGPAL
jgi:hypothetical protein